MKQAMIGILLVFAAAAAAGQSGAQAAPKDQVIYVPGSSCPVGMDARLAGGLHRMVQTNGKTVPQRPEQRLQLTLAAPRPTGAAVARMETLGKPGKKKGKHGRAASGARGAAGSGTADSGQAEAATPRPAQGNGRQVNPWDVTAATVTAYGLNGRWHATLVGQDGAAKGSSGEISKTLEVKFAAVDAGEISPGGASVVGDLVLPGFTAVTWIDLDSLTLRDGAKWKMAGNHTCRVAPDLLVPVTEQMVR